MTTWIVGHTDRFAAAVAERFVADNFSSFSIRGNLMGLEKSRISPIVFEESFLGSTFI